MISNRFSSAARLRVCQSSCSACHCRDHQLKAHYVGVRQAGEGVWKVLGLALSDTGPCGPGVTVSELRS